LTKNPDKADHRKHGLAAPAQITQSARRPWAKTRPATQCVSGLNDVAERELLRAGPRDVSCLSSTVEPRETDARRAAHDHRLREPHDEVERLADGVGTAAGHAHLAHDLRRPRVEPHTIRHRTGDPGRQRRSQVSGARRDGTVIREDEPLAERNDIGVVILAHDVLEREHRRPAAGDIRGRPRDAPGPHLQLRLSAHLHRIRELKGEQQPAAGPEGAR